MMTIKQQGGVFGRNPTFNNVAIDGTLTVDQIVENAAGSGVTLDGVTLKDGNVILADGKGIDFSATSGTGTSELFDDYEEGTWTPNQGAGLTVVGTFSSSGIYTKVGRTVDLIGEVNGSTSILIGSTAAVICTNLPFFSSAVCTGNMSNSSVNQYGGLVSSGLILYSSTTMSSTTTIRFSITYIT
jgi:hypothetical protein